MTTPSPSVPGNSTPHGVVLSVDAMGGDKGPAAVVAGLSLFLKQHPDARVLLHGRASEIGPLIARANLSAKVAITDTPDVVAMSDKPSHIMRNGKTTSMWSAIDAVRDGRAQACVSCGNTGALMAVAMIRLRKLDGVNRPAIAGYWPSHNPSGFNVVLDLGADIRADEEDLLAFALMGASYARNSLDLARPRVGLLNVGVEDNKGRAELKVANDMIAAAADRGEFDYVGFIEGGDLPSSKIDVIVTDGFTGNVALKTGEGTANLISGLLRETLKGSFLGILAGLLARGSLKRLSQRIDPRRNNGGVFLGLNGTVIKSHGSADATGIASALTLAHRLAKSGFSDKLAARVATAGIHAQDTAQSSRPSDDGPTKDEPSK